MWENWILTLALSQDSCVMLGRADPPAATEAVELYYQQLACSSFLNIQLSSLKKKKKSVSAGYL